MHIKENYDRNVVEGKVTWQSVDAAGNTSIIFSESNRILVGARTFMRDLMFGAEDDLVDHCQFGSCNVTEDDDLRIIPDEPKNTDTVLTNSLFSKPVFSKESTTSDTGRPSVTYTFSIDQTDMLNTSDGRVVIAEIGLCRKDELMFAKRTHAPILKTPVFGLRLTWEIIF